MRYWLVLVAFVGIFYALKGMVQVAPGERAVVRRFGRLLEEKPEPGLWIGWPWGIDRVDLVAVDKLQSIVVGYSDQESDETLPAGQLLTGDHNLVDVRVTIYYRALAEQLDEFIVARDSVDGLLARAAEASLAEWVACRPIDEVLLNGKTTLPGDLVASLQASVFDYRLGIELVDCRVSLLAAPERVKFAFDNVAREQARVSALINQAEQDVESRSRSAEGDRFRLEQETASYVNRQSLIAQREAERFLERLKQYEEGRKTNPNYLRQIWEEERGKLFANLKNNGQLGLLDDHLGPDGLDITIAPPVPKRP